MLFLSQFILPTVITSHLLRQSSTSKHALHIPSIPLLTLPDNIGPFYNCIHIYTWFWNLFGPIHLLHTSRHKAINTSAKKNKTSLLFCRYHLYILLYFIFNISIAAAIYNIQLPFTSLSIMPTILGTTLIYHQATIASAFIPTMPPIAYNSPIVTALSSNSEKLAFLCAWQSLNQNTH
jgi:hypothetical protein